MIHRHGYISIEIINIGTKRKRFGCVPFFFLCVNSQTACDDVCINAYMLH